MLKWGILSAAKIAVEQFAPAIQASAGSSIQAIASQRAHVFAEQFAVPEAFTSYEALLNSPNIDAVYIPTLTSDHTRHTLMALAAGKAVLCEKPMGMRADDIRQIQAEAEARNLLVGEAYMVAHHPQWSAVRNLLESGAIGELKQIQGAFTYYNDDPQNFRNQEAMGGGALRDIGVYPCITTLLTTRMKPGDVWAKIERDPLGDTDTIVRAQVSFGNFDLSFYVSTRMSSYQHMSFHGTKGRLDIPLPFNPGRKGLSDAKIRVFSNKGNLTHQETFPGINQYQNQIQAFERAYLGQAPFPVSLEQSWQVQNLVDRIFKAGEN